jgi:hypothetical protein
MIQSIIIGLVYFALIAYNHFKFELPWYFSVPAVVFTLILMYDTYCIVAGKCNIYGWLRTIVNVAGPAILFYLFITGNSLISNVSSAIPGMNSSETGMIAPPIPPTN